MDRAEDLGSSAHRIRENWRHHASTRPALFALDRVVRASHRARAPRRTGRGGRLPPSTTTSAPSPRKISTSVPKAQRYFDQGLRLVYAFNHDEAKRAFEEAARLDPACAICYWGVALTLGPNINLPALPDRAAAAVVAAKKAARAREARAKATPVERALIARAGPSGTPIRRRRTPRRRRSSTRPTPNAMRDVARRFPDDLDVQTLFAESMMDLRPWDLWTQRRQAAARAPSRSCARSSGSSRRTRSIPARTTTTSTPSRRRRRPGRALAAAKRVGAMMPGAGHLVHMPSHIYIRTGDYEAASEANRRAIDADAKYVAWRRRLADLPDVRRAQPPVPLGDRDAAGTQRRVARGGAQDGRERAARDAPADARASTSLLTYPVADARALRPLGRGAEGAGAAGRLRVRQRDPPLRPRRRAREARPTPTRRASEKTGSNDRERRFPRTRWRA